MKVKRNIRGCASPGTTLLETMIALSMIGILASLAAPSMLSLVKEQRVRAAAENVAGFLEIARRKAVTTKRCHRVVLTSPTTLRLDRRDSPDCRNLGNDGWDLGQQSLVADGNVILSMDYLGPGSDIIFRPTGRLRGDGDLDTSEEGARVSVSLAGTEETRITLVSPLGQICISRIFGLPPALVAPVGC